MIRDAIDPSGPPDAQLWSGLLAFFNFIDEHRDEWSVYGSILRGELWTPPAD